MRAVSMRSPGVEAGNSSVTGFPGRAVVAGWPPRFLRFLADGCWAKPKDFAKREVYNEGALIAAARTFIASFCQE